jgi:hypothetical protein
VEDIDESPFVLFGQSGTDATLETGLGWFCEPDNRLDSQDMGTAARMRLSIHRRSVLVSTASFRRIVRLPNGLSQCPASLTLRSLCRSDFQHLNLRKISEQLLSSGKQRLGNLTGHVGGPALLRLKRVENAEFRRPQLDCIPSRRTRFQRRKGLCRLQEILNLLLFSRPGFEQRQYRKLRSFFVKSRCIFPPNENRSSAAN